MNVFPLGLQFKGDRNYAHSTCFYDSLMEVLNGSGIVGSSDRISMTFRRVTDRQCEAWIGDPGDKPKGQMDRACGDIRIHGEWGQRFGWFVQTEEPIVGRVPFREEEIVARSVIDGETISMREESTNTPIEVLVVLTKHLHQTKFITSEGKWFLTKLELLRPLTRFDGESMSVELVQSPRPELTRSRIRGSGEEIGNVYFSMVNS